MEKKFLELYEQGFSDIKIAEKLQCCRKRIGRLRKSLGLPSVRDSTRLSDLVLEQYHLGLNDTEIAEVLNIKSKSVTHIRTKKLNLIANHYEYDYRNLTDRRKGYIIRNIKFSAKRRNIEFDLKFEDLELPKYCPVFGIKLDYTTKFAGNENNRATVDRIDNSKGYIKGNIIVISRLANAMKRDANFEQITLFSKNFEKLINFYKIQGALGSVTDVFPDIELYQEV